MRLKNVRKTITALICICFIILLLGCNPQSKLEGAWLAEDKGTIIEFFEDGTMETRFFKYKGSNEVSLIWEGYYTVLGKNEVSIQQSATLPEVKKYFDISGNRLCFGPEHYGGGRVCYTKTK